MCPSLIQIGSKTAEKNSAQTNKQTDRQYENNGHLAVNQSSTNSEISLGQSPDVRRTVRIVKRIFSDIQTRTV